MIYETNDAGSQWIALTFHNSSIEMEAPCGLYKNIFEYESTGVKVPDSRKLGIHLIAFSKDTQSSLHVDNKPLRVAWQATPHSPNH